MGVKVAASWSGLFFRALATLAGIACVVAEAVPVAAAEVKAGYFYHYMDPEHLERLAAAGFNRAVIHWNGDSLRERGAQELIAFRARGRALGVEVVPQWALQQRSRLSGRLPARRYTWGDGTAEADVACPLDSAYWRSALLERAEEYLATDSTIARLAVDLEFYWGSRHHYVDGPCRCPFCLAEYLSGTDLPTRDPRRWSGLMGWEESALEGRLTAVLKEFAARHPGVEIGVFDLDLDSFVHRALARALRRAAVPTTDYCERSYSVGSAPLTTARARLDALGLEGTPLVGGLWLKRFKPEQLPRAMKAVMEKSDGYFIFTTYSLWLAPERLEGPYTVDGPQNAYWDALMRGNAP